MRPKTHINLGLRVNYGMQQFYRDNGIEPRCGICVHFQGTPVDVERGIRFCWKQNQYVEDGNICYAPERAPGADDEP